MAKKHASAKTGRHASTRTQQPSEMPWVDHWTSQNASSLTSEAIKQTRKMTSPADYLDILHLSCSSSSSRSWLCRRQSSSTKRRARQAGCLVLGRLQLSQQPSPSADERIGRRRAPYVDVRTAAMMSRLTTATCERVGEPSVSLSLRLPSPRLKISTSPRPVNDIHTAAVQRKQ